MASAVKRVLTERVPGRQSRTHPRGRGPLPVLTASAAGVGVSVIAFTIGFLVPESSPLRLAVAPAAGFAVTLGVARFHRHGWARALAGALLAGLGALGASAFVGSVIGAGYPVVRAFRSSLYFAALIALVAGVLAALDHPPVSDPSRPAEPPAPPSAP